jgi:hypothetical protein
LRAGGVQRNAAPNRFQCHPRKQAVVAVRDGILIRSLKQQAATLQINTREKNSLTR